MNRINREYWIDREGQVHKYKHLDDCNLDNIISFHYEIASRLYPEAKNPEDILTRLGWVKVGSVVYRCPTISIKPSQAQINKLEQLGLLKLLLIKQNGHLINFSNIL